MIHTIKCRHNIQRKKMKEKEKESEKEVKNMGSQNQKEVNCE